MKNHTSIIMVLGLATLAACNNKVGTENTAPAASGTPTNSVSASIPTKVEIAYLDQSSPAGSVDALLPISSQAVSIDTTFAPESVNISKTAGGSSVSSYTAKTAVDSLNLSATRQTAMEIDIGSENFFNCSGLPTYFVCESNKITFLSEDARNWANLVSLNIGSLSYSIPIKKYQITQMSDVRPGFNDTAPLDLTTIFQKMIVAIGGNLYFRGTDYSSLYVMDAAGSISRIATNIGAMAKHNNKLYLITNSYQLLRLDSNQLIELGPISASIDRLLLLYASYNNELYFVGREKVSQSWRIYKLNATDSSITDVARYTGGNQPAYGHVIFNNALYLITGNASGKMKLMKLGADGVLSQVTNLRGDANDDNINGTMVVHNNQLYFASLTSLYRMDTQGNISLVYNQLPFDAFASAGFPQMMASLNNEFYFSGKNSGGFRKIFKITQAGTLKQVSNINPSGDDPMDVRFIEFNGELYFRSYKINTSGTVSKISDVELHPTEAMNNALYFTGVVGAIGRNKLHKLEALP